MIQKDYAFPVKVSFVVFLLHLIMSFKFYARQDRILISQACIFGVNNFFPKINIICSLEHVDAIF